MRRAMQAAAEEARHSHQQGCATVVTLSSIEKAVCDVSRMLESIAAASEQHSRETSAVSEHIQSVAEIAERSSTQIGHTENRIKLLIAEAQSLSSAAERFQLSAA